MPRSRFKIFCNECTRSTPLDPKLMFWCVSYNFGALGTIWLSYKTRCKTVVMVQKFVPRSRFGIFRNERTRSPHSTLKNVLVHFIKFWCIWDHLDDLQNSMQNGPNYCKSSCHKAASEFFATNAPVPPHWTLNSCFGAFRTILVHLGSFG